MLVLNEQRERRTLFFHVMRQPEMRWLREAFKHLKYDQGIDWREIKEIEIDPPWDHPWELKSSWIMTTDQGITILFAPNHYDGIEDFMTIPRHDEQNSYCECYYCYDDTLAKRKTERHELIV